jgi:vacuolar-type H+-ATPase subunit E/Vma4
MTMLKPIEDHVQALARVEADGIAAQAKAEAERIVASAREESDRRLKSELDKLRAELDAGLDREVSVVRSARAQELLAGKSRILDDVFRRAAERLLASAAWWDLLRARLRSLAGEKGQVLCRAEHRDTIGKCLAELKGETGGKMPPLADESAKILGGFILRGAQFDVDYSLESELASLREKILPELAAKAFPKT